MCSLRDWGLPEGGPGYFRPKANSRFRVLRVKPLYIRCGGYLSSKVYH